MEQLIFLAGILAFSCSAYYFFRQQNNVHLPIPFLVSFITIISYMIMYFGERLIIHNNKPIYFTRWIFYIFSCTLLAFDIATKLNMSVPRRIYLLYITAIVMVTGTFSSVYTGHAMWGFFGVSSIAYLILVYAILTNANISKTNIKKYILFGWSLFPVAFLFSPEGFHVIGNTYAATAYLALDVFTKIIFYLEKQKAA